MKQIILLALVATIATSCSDLWTEPYSCMQHHYNSKYTSRDTVLITNCSQNFDSIQWELDGIEISNSKGDLRVANLSPGNHIISLHAYNNKKHNSSSGSISIFPSLGAANFWGKEPNASYAIYIKNEFGNYSYTQDIYFYGTNTAQNCSYNENGSGINSLNIEEGTHEYKCYRWLNSVRNEFYGSFTVYPYECVSVTID